MDIIITLTNLFLSYLTPGKKKIIIRIHVFNSFVKYPKKNHSFSVRLHYVNTNLLRRSYMYLDK